MASSSASLCFPPNGKRTGFRCGSAGLCNRRVSSTQFRTRRFIIRSDLDSNVSDMSNNGNFHQFHRSFAIVLLNADEIWLFN